MKNKKIITMISAIVMAFSCVNMPVYAVNSTSTETITEITAENSQQLWERFLKYDLCILDYDSLTDEQKELCKFIFETELNSEDTIICERARRTLAGYDVGRRATLEDTENYYDFGDYYDLYLSIYSSYDKPYLYCVPDILHIDYNKNYNEYWLDDYGNEKIFSTGSDYVSDSMKSYKDYYLKINEDNSTDHISRPEITLEKFEDDDFIYDIYPDNSLYVCEPLDKTELSYTIPEKVNGMKVIGIKSKAFQDAKCKNVVLPDTIEYIEPHAFESCWLENINFPENLKFIGNGSFSGCTELKELVIDCPELIFSGTPFDYASADSLFFNTKYVDSKVVSYFKNLGDISFGNNVSKVGTLFADYEFMKEHNYTIPETIKFINNDLFDTYSNNYSNNLVVSKNIKVFGTYSMPAYGENGPFSHEPSYISVIYDFCELTSDVQISGYYGTEAHDYAISHNLKFNPLDDLTYGDANNDGNINIADAVSLQKYLFGNGSVGYEADLTKDGIIDSFDMILMRRMILNNQ